MSEAEMLWAAVLGLVMFNFVAGHFFWLQGYKRGYDEGIGYVYSTMGQCGNESCTHNKTVADVGKTGSDVALDRMDKKGNGKKARNT